MIRRIVTALQARRRAREDAAWQEGYEYADEQVEEFIADKDYFIAKQGEIIVSLMEVITNAGGWEHVPEELYRELQGYV